MPSARPKPPPAASRETQLRDLKRKLVLDGARAVFAKHGLEGASTRAIAQAAGCTTGAIYPYFSGKEAIYAELLSESLEALCVAVSAAAASGGAPEGRLFNGAKAFFDYYIRHSDELTLGLYLFQAVKRRGLGAELDSRLNRQLRGVLDALRPHIVMLAGESAAADAEISMLFTYLVGLLIVEHTGRLKILRGTAQSLLERYLIALTERCKKGKR